MLQQLTVSMKYILDILVIIVTLAAGLSAYSSPLQTTAVTTGYGSTTSQSKTILSRFKVFCLYEGDKDVLVTSHQLPTAQQGSLENVVFEKLQHPQFIKLAEFRKPGSETNKQLESQTNSQLNRQKPQYDSSVSWSSSQTQQIDKPTTNFLQNIGKSQHDNDHDFFPNEFSNTKWTQQKKPTFGTFSDAKPNQQTIINRPVAEYDDSYIFNSHIKKQQLTKNSGRLLADFDQNLPEINNPYSADYNPLKTSTPDSGVNSEFDYITMKYLHDHPNFSADKGAKPVSIGSNNDNFDKDYFTTDKKVFKHVLQPGDDKQQNPNNFQKNLYKSQSNYALTKDNEDQLSQDDNVWKPNYYSNFNNGQHKSDNGFTGDSKQSNNIDYKPKAKDGAISTDNPFVVVGRYRSDKDKNRNDYQHGKYATNHASKKDGKLKTPHSDFDYPKKTKSTDDDTLSGDEYSYVETPDDFSSPISNDEKPQSDDYNSFFKGNKPSTVDHSSKGDDNTGSNEDHYNTEPTTQNEKSHDQAEQPDYYSPSNNAAPNLDKEINEPTNGNPQDQLTHVDSQSQETNGKPQSENVENQPTAGNSPSLPSNGNPQSEPTRLNSQNQSTNGSQQSEPTRHSSQNQSTNGSQQSEPTGLNSQNQSLNRNPQSQQNSGFNPQNQTTVFNPQNQTTNGNSQSQPTNVNSQSQPINGNQQNQTAKGNPQNQPNGKTGRKLTPLQIIGNVVNNYIVKPVSKLFSG